MGMLSSTQVRLPAKGWRMIGGLLTALAILVTFVSPAQATIIVRAPYDVTYSDSFDDCGFVVQVEGSVRGLLLIREGTGPDETAFFAHNNYEVEEILTANGRSITLRADALYQETRATHVEESIFEFHAVEAGQPFAVYDADGNLVLRDRGVIRYTFLFDTGGDDVPGGEFVGEFEVEFGGPHPSWEMDESVICALLE